MSVEVRSLNASVKAGAIKRRTGALTYSSTVATTPSPWIISRNQDLVWFQGSVIAGLGLLFVFRALPSLDSSNYSIVHPAVLALLAWGVMLDGTHVFSTYARTYFAADAESRAGLPGHWSWMLLLVGPAIAVADHAFLEQGPSLVGHAGILFRYFLVGAFLWAYYHLIRQHYGFLCLYGRKSADTTSRFDGLLLWIGTLYPFVRFTFSPSYAASGLPHLLPSTWFSTATIALDATFSVLLVTCGICVLWAFLTGTLRFAPKHLLLFIVVSFHILVFALLDNLLTITATLTIFHNLQYHRIVWQYERGKGRVPLGSIPLYLALGLLLGVLWYTPRTLGVAASQSDLVCNLLLAFGWGIAFHHYLLDSRIWRVRRQPTMARTLDKGAER